MSGINPISGMRPATGANPASKAAGQSSSTGKTDFGELIKSHINKINQDQSASALEIQNLLSGKSQDILPVVSAMAEADMSLKLLIGVRNKVIEAYKQTMNMQI